MTHPSYGKKEDDQKALEMPVDPSAMIIFEDGFQNSRYK